MVWFYFIALLLVLFAGLALVIVTLPGLWLMLAGAATYAMLTHFQYVGLKMLITLLILSFAGEVLELGLGGREAKKAGGGRRAMIGGLVGGVLGGIFLTFIPIPVISTIFGICLGSFLGAAGFEVLGGEQYSHSIKVGWGAAKGRFYGIISKLVIGIAMLILTFFAALPIGGPAVAVVPPPPVTRPATAPW